MRNPDAQLRAALDRLLSLAGEGEARRLLFAVGRPVALQELERVVAERIVARLLADRAPRREIVDRLQARGLPARTAYRRIQATLDAGRPISATAGRAMAKAGATLAAIPLPEPPTMPATLQSMHDRLESLKAQHAAIDIPAARRAAEVAQQRCERLEAEQGQSAPAPALMGYEGNLAERDSARAARKSTAARVRTLETHANDLARQIANLNRLLTGESRVAPAQEAVESERAAVQVAEQELQAAETAMANIVTLLAETERGVETARAAAADQVLALARGGGGKSLNITADQAAQVAAIEQARAMQQQPVEDARQRLNNAGQRLRGAEQQVRAALADASELAHELALGSYVEALAQTMAMHAQAHGRGFSVADPRSLAAERYLELVEADQRP